MDRSYLIPFNPSTYSPSHSLTHTRSLTHSHTHTLSLSLSLSFSLSHSLSHSLTHTHTLLCNLSIHSLFFPRTHSPSHSLTLKIPSSRSRLWLGRLADTIFHTTSCDRLHEEEYSKSGQIVHNTR